MYPDYYLVFIKVPFLVFLSPKFTFFLLILILGEKKVNFFITSLGVQGVILYLRSKLIFQQSGL